MKKLIIIVTILLFCISANSQKRRVALVIGNANYPMSILANPVNDAIDIEALLKSSGFQVKRYSDLDQMAMKRVIDEFGNSLNNAEVGLFFYAGHGIQANGRNYLIPVDASLKTENDVEYNCVDAGRILARMEDAGTKTNIVILDACRDNPFERSWSRKSTGQGLAFMDAPMGSLIAYSTAPGKTASDGYYRNSPYTSALIQYMKIPNVKIEDFFKMVRVSVREKTKGQQIPWESTSLEGDFYFQLDPEYVSEDIPTPAVESRIGDELINTDKIISTEQRLLNFEENKKRLAAEIKSIAILPFSNYTGDENLAYLVSGLHDALISELGQIGAIRVVGKTSTLPYANFQKTIKEIASELNVDGIIEASVQIIDKNIMVRLKLLSAFPEEQQLWSQTFNSDMSDVLNLYNRVIKDIANEIRVSLSPEQQTKLAKTQQVNPEAYDAYMKGRYYWEQLTEDGLQKALEYFNLAIERETNWGPPYAGIAEFWIGMRQMGLAPVSSTISNIYEYLNKAMELDPNSANTHYVNALAAVWTGFNWEKGEREFLKALEINPNNAYARAYYAHLLMTLQRPDEALSQIQLAIDLDPLNTLIQSLYGGVLLDARDYELAITQAEKVLSAVPNHPIGLAVLSMAHFFNKDYEESIEAWITYFRLNEETKLAIQKTFNEQGFHAAIEEFIIELKKATGDSYPMDIAQLYTVVNNYTKALEWYEKAYKNHDPNMPYLSTSFISFNNIKDNPGFIELLKKMNLPLNKKDRK